MEKPCNVNKQGKCKDATMSLGLLVIIATIFVVVGVFLVILAAFLPITSTQSGVISSISIPLFIFGLVMFGITLSAYVKKLSKK